ncbi:gene transfer agent family protein [Pseudophaeobacter sp. C1-32P7]|uniref:gene transfer agent family protein n=1 Tax=Pseudophaeobacter sp. C1-32P7 TaxID=3098142 RepID=UPI0034D56DE1
MDTVVCEWAGKERSFRLPFGGVMDLEQAAGDNIGRIFARVVGSQFSAKDVYHTIRLALIGGGATVTQAKVLMTDHFDARPYLENASVAAEILCALMTGVEEEGEDVDQSGEATSYKFSDVVQICRVFHMSPAELRDMRYADFVNMVRGFNAASDTKAPHLSEEEFEDILRRYEPEAVT